ncbi:phosphoglycolate phosphatase [Salinisphaera aquimarina]|uniref:Phosphoglycolate phosphatase n=1 Tax=Salinisphaera aquimarina TaxID=2094031 RepID=A0ABV7EJ76_9GAMM
MHKALDDIALVVFDLDGTLIDSAPDLTTAVAKTLADYGLEPAGLDSVRHWVGNGSHKLVERALANAAADGVDTDEAHEAFLRHYAAAPCTDTVLYDGVRECLESLRDQAYDLMLVTNKPIAFLPPILDALDLNGFFSLTLGGDSLTQKKPDPAPLLYAARQGDIAPGAGLMIGDSRHDVQAGKAAGFRTLAVTYGYNHGDPISDSGPDHIVDSLAELL